MAARSLAQVCGEGGCGACTVVVSYVDAETDRVLHRAVNACLFPLCSADGMAVTTVEGLGSVATRLHPIQAAMAQGYGSQCGFCTPGMIMSMYALLRTHPKPTRDQLADAMQGNLCRCTGYRAIVQSLLPFTEDGEVRASSAAANGDCALGTKCCRYNGADHARPGDGADDDPAPARSAYVLEDPTQALIFPPELACSAAALRDTLCIRGPRVTWHRPATLAELLALKHAYPSAKWVTRDARVARASRAPAADASACCAESSTATRRLGSR